MAFMKLFGFVLIAILLCAGCQEGIKRNGVEGTITVDGKPVQEGAITFRPQTGTAGPVTGGSITEGQYRIDRANGPVAGEYHVDIIGRSPTGRKIITEAAGDKIETAEMKNIIPKKNRTADETTTRDPEIGKEPLTATITQGKNTIDFHLTNH